MKISFLKPLIGLTIILIIIYFLDLKKTIDLILNIELSWFIAAIFLKFFACLIICLRYQKILSYKNLNTKFYFQTKIYFEGIMLTSLLPIGQVGIDLWRAKAIKKISDFSYLKIFNTLLSDRISGLLAIIANSTLASVGIYLFYPNIISITSNLKILTIPIFELYILLCFVLSLSSILAWLIFRYLKVIDFANMKLKKLIKYFDDALSPKLIINTFFLSLINNISVMTCFWFCAIAVGIDLPYSLMISLGLAIIIPAVLPLTLGGFGPREAGAVILLSLFEVSIEQAFICSVIFGITLIIQSLIGVIFFVIPNSE